MSIRKLAVDLEKYAGAGVCMAVAPASFKLGEDFITVHVIPPGDQEEHILQAIDQRPMRAIFFVDEPGQR